MNRPGANRSIRRTSLRVLTAAVLAAAATVIAVSLAAARSGRSTGGAEIAPSAVRSGSEKQRILIREEATPTLTAPSPRGRPTEEWSPDVQPSIDDSGESPYPQRRDLVIDNAWHSGVAADGTITSVYAGMEYGDALLIVVRADLLTGLEVFHRELRLPADVTNPKVVSVDGSIVRVESTSGRSFTLDLDTLTVDAV
jgi:hypothetical protein